MRPHERSVGLRLQDILRAIDGIRQTVGGLDIETYAAVWSVKHASERGIEIISEASRHSPRSMKDAAPEIPWQRIADMGNVLRHGYETVSDHVVWDIIKNHLPPLEAAVRRLMHDLDVDRTSD